MADDYRTLQVACVGIRPLGPSHVRCGDGQVFDMLVPQVRKEYVARIEMVDREIEESLDLVCMQVACHDPVASCCMEDICHELGTD